MMRILAFLVVWGAKVGRSFALCHRVRNTLVPEYVGFAASTNLTNYIATTKSIIPTNQVPLLTLSFVVYHKVNFMALAIIGT
jgi:hypothetical protein